MATLYLGDGLMEDRLLEEIMMASNKNENLKINFV